MRGPDMMTELERISILELLNMVLRYRRTVVVCTLAPPLVGVIILLALPRQYSSNVSFFPQGGGSSPSRLSSLAGHLGLSVGGGGTSESPDFYADLLNSRRVLGPIACDSFDVSSTAGNVRRPLAELLDLEIQDGRAREAAVVGWLREEAVAVQTDPSTGVITLSVTTRWPELSQMLAAQLVERVNAFNLNTRQSQAAAERKFVEQQLGEAKADLRTAEDEFEEFLRNNRAFQNSPELVFEHERLRRRVARRQQLVTSLSDAFVQAHISEVRNTPVITVVDSAEVPVRPQSRSLGRTGGVALLFGAMLGLAAAFGKDYVLRRKEANAADYSELTNLWAELKTEIRWPLGKSRGIR